jgi:hypothetical protein
MRAYVFTDQALGRYAGQFVWLSVDTENGRNARFLEKYPIHVWPTLMVVDPRREKVILRYSGGATVPQLSKLLDDGRNTYSAKGQSASDKLLTEADRLVSEDKSAEAAKAYQQAIEQAPKKWSVLGRAAESYTLTLLLNHEYDQCVAAARKIHPQLEGTVSGANVASVGLGCATELKPDAAGRAEAIRYFETAARAALADPSLDFSGDDRSGLYDSLVSAREDAKDEAGAKTLREQWAAFLEGEAARARTPEQRAVYDPHRLGVYLGLKTPEKAIPMLLQSERDFPADYNPPARLAAAYRAMGRLDDALAANEIALSKAYGPRKIGIYRTRADLYLAKGYKTAARAVMADAIRYAGRLPAGQRSAPTIAALQKKLSEIPQ